MTQEQVNRMLFKFEKPNYYVGGHFDYPQYTTDWNEFHRIWIKYLDDNDRCINATDSMLLLPFIYRHPTPLQAATRLAQIINDKK